MQTQKKAINKETVNAHIVLARIHGIDKNPDIALSHYNRAIEITNSEDGVAFWWRGIFYRDLLRKYEESLSDIDTAILRFENSIIFACFLAWKRKNCL